MADLPSTFTKVNDVEVAPDAPVTEALYTKLGQNDNYLYDTLTTEIATRGAVDSNLQSQISTIVGEVNDLDLVPVQVFTGSISIAGFDIGIAQKVATFWFEKRTGAGETWAKLQVFNDDGDDMWLDNYYNLSVNPNSWDYGTWNFEQDTDSIRWRLYNMVSVQVP